MKTGLLHIVTPCIQALHILRSNQQRENTVAMIATLSQDGVLGLVSDLGFSFLDSRSNSGLWAFEVGFC